MFIDSTLNRAIALLAAMLAMACGSSQPPAPSGNFAVSSSQLSTGFYPKSTTCDGGDHRPTLQWTQPPGEAKGFVIELLDPDVPGSYTHWLLYDMGPAVNGIGGSLPAGSVEGKNSSGTIGYKGPCPPHGSTHRYHLTVYALVANLKLAPGVDRATLDGAIAGDTIGKAELTATYSR
jgi:Raf kinase inhibitor-like YbhB/YbcL family protein